MDRLHGRADHKHSSGFGLCCRLGDLLITLLGTAPADGDGDDANLAVFRKLFVDLQHPVDRSGAIREVHRALLAEHGSEQVYRPVSDVIKVCLGGNANGPTDGNRSDRRTVHLSGLPWQYVDLFVESQAISILSVLDQQWLVDDRDSDASSRNALRVEGPDAKTRILACLRDPVRIKALWQAVRRRPDRSIVEARKRQIGRSGGHVKFR